MDRNDTPDRRGLSDDDGWPGSILGACLLLLAGLIGWHWRRVETTPGRIIAVAILALCAVGGLFTLFSRGGVIIDRSTRQMIWWHRWLFVRGQKVAGFSEFSAVVVIQSETNITGSFRMKSVYRVYFGGIGRKDVEFAPQGFDDLNSARKFANDMSAFTGLPLRDLTFHPSGPGRV